MVPDDVTTMAHAILRHRLVLTFEALAERVAVDDLIDDILAAVPTP